MFKKIITKVFSFICIMMFALTSIPTGAFAATNASSELTKVPKIEFFNTSSENVAPGETVNLTWRVLGAKSVEITGEEKEVECVSEGSLEVWPMVTTEYTLHAYGFNGEEVTKTVLVKVGAAKVNKFTASAEEVAPGEAVTLNWDVYNTENVAISNTPDSKYAPQGSIVVYPTKSTTYTLTAVGLDGQKVTSEVKVKVKDPVIKVFTASSEEVAPGEVVTLNWDVANASNVTISNTPDAQYPASGSVKVNPVKSTTYTLTAVGADGQTVTAEVKVKVKDPVIKAFTVSSQEVAPGEAVTLNWDVANVSNVTISNTPDAKYPAKGSLTVNPYVSTTYTLTAVGADGQVVTAKVDVKVKTPVIVSFSSSKAEITKGDTVVLSWNVLYAKSVKIVGIEKQPESNSGSIEVWPLTTTTYKLIVEGYDGSQITQDLTVVVKDPLIGSFTASKTEIIKGEMVTLSWTTNGAVSCSLETSTGTKLKNTPINGSISVTPNKDMTFTLVVTDKNGNVKSQSITITVIKKNELKGK